MILRVAHLTSWEARTEYRRMNENKLSGVRGSVCIQSPALKCCNYKGCIHQNNTKKKCTFNMNMHLCTGTHRQKPSMCSITWESTACPLASKWTSKRLSMHTSMLKASLQQEKLTYTSWLSLRDKSSDCIISELSLSNGKKKQKKPEH